MYIYGSRMEKGFFYLAVFLFIYIYIADIFGVFYAIHGYRRQRGQKGNRYKRVNLKSRDDI
jgi:hypothetical protein